MSALFSKRRMKIMPTRKAFRAWQVGMYGFMAFAKFYLFPVGLGVGLRVDGPEFWFVMQIAMLFGFLTSYPANWWLLRAGIKEKM